jgi:hypothetical protein
MDEMPVGDLHFMPYYQDVINSYDFYLFWIYLMTPDQLQRLRSAG